MINRRLNQLLLAIEAYGATVLAENHRYIQGLCFTDLMQVMASYAAFLASNERKRASPVEKFEEYDESGIMYLTYCAVRCIMALR